MRACVRACVREVRACVRACVRKRERERARKRERERYTRASGWPDMCLFVFTTMQLFLFVYVFSARITYYSAYN